MKERSELATSAATLVACAATAVLISGCGGGNGGSGSIISGNVSNTSTAMAEPAEPSMLARAMRFLAPVTNAFAGREGITVRVDGREVETDPNGFFVVTGGFSGVVTVEFDNGDRTFSVDIDVPEGSTIVLRDIDLLNDGSANPSEVEFRLRGELVTVDCQASMLTIHAAGNDVDFTMTPSTRIQVSGQGSSDRTCAELESLAPVGERVKVEGTVETGVLVADRVQVNPDDGGEDGDVEFKGTVSAKNCPDSITVQRTDGENIEVVLDADTRFERVADCNGLASNAPVEIHAMLEANQVVATEVELED